MQWHSCGSLLPAPLRSCVVHSLHLRRLMSLTRAGDDESGSARQRESAGAGDVKRREQWRRLQQQRAQHSTAQHSTAQHSTAQHSTAQHGTVSHPLVSALTSSNRAASPRLQEAAAAATGRNSAPWGCPPPHTHAHTATILSVSGRTAVSVTVLAWHCLWLSCRTDRAGLAASRAPAD